MKRAQPAAGDRRALLVRLVKWSLMLVTLLWFLVWRAAQDDSGVPEFLYVNF